MSGKALFFLRHYNDIDHMVPVIYKWLSLEEISTDVVVTTEPGFLSDFRIQFLRQFENLQTHFIDDFAEAGEREAEPRDTGTDRVSRPNPVRRRRGIWNRLFHRRPPAPIQVPHDEPFVENMLNAVFENVDRGIVVFDWTYKDFVRLVVEAAKGRGLTTISLPHGDRPYCSRLETLDALDYSHMEGYAPGAMFDYTVVPNALCAERYTPYMGSDRVKVLGSPRYNDEWLDIISTLIPAYDPEKGLGKLKIVFFFRNLNYPVFWGEVARTTKLILQFPDVYLIVKYHTRKGRARELIEAYPEVDVDAIPNLEFVDYDVHSVSLLKWADVVLDPGTSVTFEAVKCRKPVLAMEYLVANRTTIGYYMKSCDVRCRDDLYDWIERFSRNGTADFYDETDRQRFISQMIDVPDKHVLGRYVAFLKSCL